MKKNGFLLGLFLGTFIALAILVICPALAYFSFATDKACIMMGTDDFSSGSVLTFYGSVLSAGATIFLGWAALKQNEKFDSSNKNSQNKLESFNNRLLRIEENRDETEIMKLYLDYINEIDYFVLLMIRQKDIAQTAGEPFMVERLEMSIKKINSLKNTLRHLDKNNKNDEFFDYVNKVFSCHPNELSGKLSELITKKDEFLDRISDSFP